MRREVFRGSTLRHAFGHARAALGDDVVILRTDVSRDAGGTAFEITVATAQEVETFRSRFDVPVPRMRRAPTGRGDIGPFIVALVGPTGVGKTTTTAKLALAAPAFRHRSVGVLTLDTFRVGAVEQIGELTGLAGLSLEVAYDAKDVPRALARLDRCDVVIIDTPGRSPRAQHLNAAWRAMLHTASPDEVHLMIPSGLRPTLVGPLCAEYATCRPTHAMLAKADELTDDASLVELAEAADLPVRWITVGQDIPNDLDFAQGRVLSALIAPRAADTLRPVAA